MTSVMGKMGAQKNAAETATSPINQTDCTTVKARVQSNGSTASQMSTIRLSPVLSAKSENNGPEMILTAICSARTIAISLAPSPRACSHTGKKGKYTPMLKNNAP